jgi:hypothetical protein
MRLVCLHADTVDALKRLHIELDDLTPTGLWSSQYHLVGLTLDQFEALELFRVEAEDVTPAQLAQAVSERPKTTGRETAPSFEGPTVSAPPEIPATDAELGWEPGSPTDSEVPLAMAGEVRADTRPEPKPNGRTTTQVSPDTAQPEGSATGAQQAPAQKGGKGGAAQVVPPAQGIRKGQPAHAQAGGQRYGTTRLRISVAGKYTEATVANGKIVIGGRTFDSPDQAAAELTKSRGDWTFWEYYDSSDGKWRMLTRDWDTVLKSAAPGGR